MYRGTAGPLIVWGNQTIQLPSPKKGGRDEQFKPIGKVYYTNIHHTKIFNPNLEFEFIAKYKWDRLDSVFVEQLISIRNNADIVNLYPHSDFTAFRVPVVIEDIQIPGAHGYTLEDAVELTCSAVSPRKKIPSMNNMFVGYQPTRISRI